MNLCHNRFRGYESLERLDRVKPENVGLPMVLEPAVGEVVKVPASILRFRVALGQI